MTTAAVVLMAGLGLWAFSAMREAPFEGLVHRGGGLQGRMAHVPGAAPAVLGSGVPQAIPARGTAGDGPVSYRV